MPDRAILEAFVEEARAVTIKDAAERLGLRLSKTGQEHPQPCPVSGGTDRFSFNTRTNKWNCRHCLVGGQDAIGMVAHCIGHDLRTLHGLLETCATVLGREIPKGGERESETDRAEREARIAELRAQNEKMTASREQQNRSFRDVERRKARGIWEAAMPLNSLSGCEAHDYLSRRGCAVPDDGWLGFSASQTYWHGTDDRGQPREIHCGPAMIAPFLALEESGWEVVGCHITWIDLGNGPKFRPLLLDPATGEALPGKKMRGTKKGGLIPLAGTPSSLRWLGAEGIENTLAFASVEQLRADTFYFAAGDLGNLTGPADPASRFAHPSLKKEDRAGKLRPVMVPGPVPAARGADGPDAMHVPDHVDELVLLADGDSEPVMTASAMVRARMRLAREGRLIPVIWPRRGTDFAGMLAGSDDAFETERTA